MAWERRPEVFYDRRALNPARGPRACLHAKVVVQDEARTLITSANLTEAAQQRKQDTREVERLPADDAPAEVLARRILDATWSEGPVASSRFV